MRFRSGAFLLLLVGCQDFHIASSGEPVYGAQPEALAPSTVVEHFAQRPPRASDVLFVVDDSGSFSDEQARLADNFQRFASYLIASDTDWHVGVVRIGEPDGGTLPDGRLAGFPPYLDPTTQFAAQAFATTVEGLGTDGGSTCESGLVASRRALSEPVVSGWNAGFYREDALLTVIVVTDEEDHGFEDDCGSIEGSSDAWVRWALDLKGGDPDRVHFGIIGSFDPADNVTPKNCDGTGQNDDGAQVYAHVLTQLPGASWSVCADDWSPVLDSLGLAAAGLRSAFDLRNVPRVDTSDWDQDGDTTEVALRVELDRLDGAGFVDVEPVWSSTPDAVNPWSYSRRTNSVVFETDAMPEPGWALQVSYPNAGAR